MAYEKSRRWLKYLGHCHMEEPEEAPRVGPGLALAVVAIWRMNQ